MKENEVYQFEELNQYHFPFMENHNQDNDVFHLNGHRGFFISKENKQIFQLKHVEHYDSYWTNIDWLYKATINNSANFHEYIKYAWGHNLDSDWFKKIYKVLEETEILVIIGYSFPPFNRKIDQDLFSKLNSKRIKKIVYQDPNANQQIIENLFTNPVPFKNKIEIEKDNLNQFYLPNEHFITQKSQSIEIK